MLPLTPLISYLIRTSFDDEDGWKEMLEILEKPDPFGSFASVEPISNPSFSERNLSDVLQEVPVQSWPLFLADWTTFSIAGFPVIVASHHPDNPPFRVYVRDTSLVTNNLPIGNLGWNDFSERDDLGVWDARHYRG